MTKRTIDPTEGLEVFINEGGSISLKQSHTYDGEHTVVIELRDVETVRQWLAELLAEATAGE